MFFPFITSHCTVSSMKQRLCVRDGRKAGKEKRKAARREASFDSKLTRILSLSLVFVSCLNVLPIILQSLVLQLLPSHLSKAFFTISSSWRHHFCFVSLFPNTCSHSSCLSYCSVCPPGLLVLTLSSQLSPNSTATLASSKDFSGFWKTTHYTYSFYVLPPTVLCAVTASKSPSCSISPSRPSPKDMPQGKLCIVQILPKFTSGSSLPL